MCAPRRAAAVVRPRGREKSADRRRRILISRLLIIRASVPRWKSPFPAYFKGFPAVSPLIPPYPAFLKYPVSPQLAVVVGMFQGGIQALSRSHFAKIIPPEKSGEYFGLFDICGKGASFLGTMIVSVGSQLTGSANVGVGSLIVLFIVGFVLFRVSDRK